MPLPRFRIRTLMIVVAVVGGVIAVCVEACRLWRFRKDCLGRAAYHSSEMSVFKQLADWEQQEIARWLNEEKQYRAEKKETLSRLKANLDKLKETRTRKNDDFEKRMAERARKNSEFQIESTSTGFDIVIDYAAKQAQISRQNWTQNTKSVDYHFQLSRKYTWAASHPWRPLALDPPSPEEREVAPRQGEEYAPDSQPRGRSAPVPPPPVAPASAPAPPPALPPPE